MENQRTGRGNPSLESRRVTEDDGGQALDPAGALHAGRPGPPAFPGLRLGRLSSAAVGAPQFA